MANGGALGKFGGELPRARRLTWGSAKLVYFLEPTLRTQLHMSVCGPSRHFVASQQFGRFRSEADISGGGVQYRIYEYAL